MIPKLGELLVNAGVLTRERLDYALQIQVSEKKLIGQVLIDLKYIDQETLSYFLQRQANITMLGMQSSLSEVSSLLGQLRKISGDYRELA